MTNGTSYCFQLRAVSSAGDGTPFGFLRRAGVPEGGTTIPTDPRVTVPETRSHTFSVADFGTEAASLTAVYFRKGPDRSWGRLSHNGPRAHHYATVSRADLEAGRLVFTPKAHWGVAEGVMYFVYSLNGEDHIPANRRIMWIDVGPTGVCERTTVVSDKIVAAVAGVTECAKVSRADLAEIETKLMFPSNALQTSGLQAGDFDGLTGLTELNLRDNGLTALPAGIFDDLTALSTLVLLSNGLTALPAGIFHDLTALTDLSLDRNRLDALPAGIFDDLTALTVLRLDTNRLKDLPEGVFKNLTALEELFVYGNPESSSFVPVANAGADHMGVTAGRRVFLPGSATGPWGSNVTYAWKQVTDEAGATEVTTDPVTLAIADMALLSFIMPTLNNVYFRLTVTGKGTTITGTDTVKVTTSASTALATAAPSVTGISLAPPAGNDDWAPDETVEVTLTFDEEVTVDTTGGTPTVALALGNDALERSASYTSGSGSTHPVFAYTLTKSDGSHGSMLVSPDSLALNGGTIRSVATGADAALGHNGTAAILSSTPSLPRTPTDPTARFDAVPDDHDGQSTFTFELHFSETPADGFSYQTLQDHVFTVTGGEVTKARRLDPPSNISWEITINPASNADVTIVLPITTDCTADGAVCTGDGRKLSNRLEITVSGPAAQQSSQQQQENSAATGSPTISGRAQVGQTLTVSTAGIADTDGLTNALYTYQWVANDGTSDSDIADATASAYTLTAGDVGKTIKVKVTFTDGGGNEETLTSAATAAVGVVVAGAPGSLSVSVNDTGKLDLSWSAPVSDGGSAVTGYKVQRKEAADSWDAPADVSETTVTGTSHTESGLTDGVEYTFRVVAVNSAGDSSASTEESGTPRETTAPTVSSASVDGATLAITFSEDLSGSPVPATTTFTVTVGQNERTVDAVAISGSMVTLTLASAVVSGDQVTVSYTVPAEATAARLKDLSKNSAASFAGQTVTNNTAAVQTPLTASVHSEPTAHDGQAEFTFELRFSENLESFSYRTLRDHAFTVTGGEITKARRLDPPGNISWEITISPTSSADVTVVLPITTDCTADSAICTGDGRKLSNRLQLTVSGPGS